MTRLAAEVSYEPMKSTRPLRKLATLELLTRNRALGVLAGNAVVRWSGSSECKDRMKRKEYQSEDRKVDEEEEEARGQHQRRALRPLLLFYS